MSEQRNPNLPGNTSLNSTRQLLDELDLLMKRMMALPVGNAETPAESATATATDLVVPPPTEEPVQTAEPEPETTESTSHRTEVEVPPSYFYEQLESDGEESVSEEAIEEAPSENLDPASSLEELPVITSEKLAALTGGEFKMESEPIINHSRLMVERVPRTSRWWLWPVTLLNRAFDFFTYLLGPLGAWLREPGGRLFLGWLGVALLLSALCLHFVFWSSGK